MFLIPALLFTFNFSSFGYAHDGPFDSAQGQLLTLIAKADYPSLMKNGFIEEVGSEGGNGKTNRNDQVSESKNSSDKVGFHYSASFGFSEEFHHDNGFDMHKPGFNCKLAGDYWFGNHFGLGIEFQLVNLSGNRFYSHGDYWLSYYDESGYYISPYAKFGLITRQNWRIFFDLGLGYGESEYGGEDPNDERIFVKFALGWSIKINKNCETGIIIDNKLIDAAHSGLAGVGFVLSLFSVSPFIGFVF